MIYVTFSHVLFVYSKVSNWFANARRRLKNVVQESHCTWSKRLRLYNGFVQGNAELLSISSNDSIWNSDNEGERFLFQFRVENYIFEVIFFYLE